MAAHVLLIEDDADTAALIADTLRAVQLRVTHVAEAAAGLAEVGNGDVDCVLLDYRLRDGDGLQCLREIVGLRPDVPVVMITGWGSEEVAVEAMKLGARDYIAKHGRWLITVPVKVREALGRARLERMTAHMRRELHAARDEVSRLRHDLVSRYRANGIIGESLAIGEAMRQAELAAHTRATVLLEGETGTGKELFARAIHYHGARARGPFEVLSCTEPGDGTLQSDLYGHVRGGFTGAVRDRRGAFARADGGTLFLDEVGKAPLAVQEKLLRIVEDGVLRPVGGDECRQVDVRIIAATNGDLRKAVQEGRLLPDLYHRLSVFPIRLPPLRERVEDIRLLAAHFLHALGQREGKGVAGFEPATLQILQRYPWPGNVRELQNEVYRALIRADEGARITPALLTPALVEAAAPDGARALDRPNRPLREIVDEVTTTVITDALRRNGNHRARTARSLGVSREWLWAMMRRLRIGRSDSGEPAASPAAPRSPAPTLDAAEPARRPLPR
jgi:two-component system response regulator AtoC